MSARSDEAETAAPAPTRATLLEDTLHRQQRAFALDMNPSLAERLDRLDRLLVMTYRIEPAMIDAIAADFGYRSRHETLLADVMIVRAAIRHTRGHLVRWMRLRRVSTAAAYWPGRGHTQPQPLDVVGIVSPWNYPFQLAVLPALSALAAGNRVMIKPSEQTPRFSALLARAVEQSFAADEMTVLCGGADVGRAFVALPFDHLLFTGSTAVGRQVALAAAANLTPVTLELGGKSPAILGADCDLAEAAPRLVAGKLFNAGQTCIAPDYLLVHQSLMTALPDTLRAAVARLYPTIAGNPDYTSLVSDQAQARLEALLDDARTHGARVLPLHHERATVARRMPPRLVLQVNDGMALMRHEIFGPLLPVVAYERLDDALAYVNRHDRPLALYWFGRNTAEREQVLRDTICGGVTINDCLLHVAQQHLPFGGIGPSGHGRYHGEAGFRTFSHDKPVFVQSRHSGVRLMSPPYGRAFGWLRRWVERAM